MSYPKKHHYVPQFVLRNFASENGTHLYVFDKQTAKVFSTNIANVAAENRLYEFSMDGVTTTIEPSLANFESKAATVLREVLSCDALTHLTQHQRLILSRLVAHLLLRSPQQRALMRHLNAELRMVISAMGVDPDLAPQLKALNENDEKLFTANVLSTLVEQFATIIADKNWILHSVSETELLYISDNPVAMNNERKERHRGNLGLAVEGIEVYLPLSRTRCLGMYCSTLASEIIGAYEGYQQMSTVLGLPLPPAPPEAASRLYRAFRTGEISPLPKESVLFINSLQVWNAERYVYSSSDDFDLACDMVITDPDIRKGPRPRVGG